KALSGVTLSLSLLLAGCGGSDNSSSTPPAPVPFSFVEATIESLHTSLRTGGATCESVVQGYIDRIHAYDDTGTDLELNSVIAINPYALEEAREKDAQFAERGIDGAMYCVPVLPKDNFNTKD